MADPNDLQIEQTDDGEWAVVRDGRTLSTHPNQAGAEAERTRMAGSEQDPEADDPSEYAPEEGPDPDNVGS